ncbi:MAG: FtsX-like permease family protein, partial [Mollicutes bacterium]|nr:FtsX-like permease family protein [Mollicutes bacterium]
PKGFNRLLQFETLIVGLKALFYALPVSLGIIYLINKSASDMVTFSDMMIPWKSIMFAVIGVFVIISITMWYATRRIKKENILDAIREENI